MVIRHPLWVFLTVATLAWVSLGIVGKLVQPQGILAPTIFLLILFFALTTSLTPLAQVIGARLVRSKWYQQQSLRHALRQGTLLATAIIVNLVLLLLHAWFWADVVLLVLAIILIELIALARK
ncbi:MAG TPA: hypothetical protein VH540_27620 [Ktedonobacterales bacterium]|jgi:hypothetical protein